MRRTLFSYYFWMQWVNWFSKIQLHSNFLHFSSKPWHITLILEDFQHFYSTQESYCSLAPPFALWRRGCANWKKDFDRIDSGILFDEKSCLWKYIQSAIETNHVTKESTCIKLLNSTYVQNLRILRVSDLSCHLRLFHIFQIKEWFFLPRFTTVT